MPWTPAQATAHTKAANTPQKQRQWASTANSVLRTCLAAGGTQKQCEGKAIRIANAAVSGKVSEDMSRIKEAVWTAAYINTLPDSSFAYISPGGTKDDTGRTAPRGLRHLPYKDASGTVDKAHVRNALARLPQTDIPAAAKASARAKLLAAARGVGIQTAEQKGSVTQTGVRVQETVNLTADVRADREAGVLRGVRVLNRASRNGRTYVDSALRDVAELMNGKRCYADHNEKGTNRSIRELIGIWTGGTADTVAGGVTADLKIVPGEERLFDIAEKMPEAIAMSIDAEALVSKRHGMQTVHRVTALRSIDAVNEGGTTQGLFENKKGGESGMDISTLADLKEQMPELVAELQEEITREVTASSETEVKIARLDAELKTVKEQFASASKKADELETEKKLREKKEAIDAAISEAKLPEMAVTPVWRKSLDSLDDGQIKEAIEDRKKLVEQIPKGHKPVSQQRGTGTEEEIKSDDLLEALTG